MIKTSKCLNTAVSASRSECDVRFVKSADKGKSDWRNLCFKAKNRGQACMIPSARRYLNNAMACEVEGAFVRPTVPQIWLAGVDVADADAG